VHILKLDAFQIRRTQEHYLKEKNVWNVCEYDLNKLAMTIWQDSNVYLIDRNDPISLTKP